MIEWIAGSVSAMATGAAGAVAYSWSRKRRRRHDRVTELARRRPEIVRGRAPTLSAADPSPELQADFDRTPIVRVPEFLSAESLAVLRNEALAAAPRKTRSYIPTHKKGGTVGHELLHDHCPACLAFYHEPPVGRWVSKLVGIPVREAGDHDQSANSILYYDEAGDHIQWHFDHNFYKGRQFTALLNLVNRGATGGLSKSTLQYLDRQGNTVDVDTSENVFIVFEGAVIRHRATPTDEGDLRIMLSMTFNTDPRISPVGEALRRVKDTAFFGLRALWS